MTQFEQTLKVMSLCGAAFLSGLAVYHQFVLPSHLADANFKIVRLEERVQGSDNARLTKELSDTGSELAKARKVHAETQKRIQDIEYAPLFEKGSPLPVGLRQIKPGDPSSRITEVYPAASIQPDKDGDWITVRDQHKAFKDATYYVKDGTITQVAFFVFDKRPSFEFLLERLKDALGEPNEITEGRQQAFYWTSQDWVAKLVIRRGDYSYGVTPAMATSSTKPPEKQRPKTAK